MIAGWNLTSPRTEIPLSSTDMSDGSALIVGHWKLVLGAQSGYGYWTGQYSPNETKPYKDAGCPDGCLFNIIKDPTEHDDLSLEFPEIKESLMARHREIGVSAFQTDCYGQIVNSSTATIHAESAKINGVWAPYGLCTTNISWYSYINRSDSSSELDSLTVLRSTASHVEGVSGTTIIIHFVVNRGIRFAVIFIFFCLCLGVVLYCHRREHALKRQIQNGLRTTALTKNESSSDSELFLSDVIN